MTNLTAPLSEEEIDRLADFLDSLESPEAMSIERLDGFLCALIAGPETVMPSEYLPLILGAQASDAPSFDSVQQAQDILNLLTRHANAIATTLNEGEIYLPILLLDDGTVSKGKQWTTGFVQGMDMRRESWRNFFSDDDAAGAIVPIFSLAHENHPDPTLRFESPTPQRREEMLQLMPAGLHKIYQYFARQRGNHLQQPITRTAPKIGRNDPCHCGSGKKYKQCCLKKVH